MFRVGRHVLSASALEVEGIIQRPDRINKLPAMPDHALGVFMFRGEWPLAISLRRTLEVEDGTERTEGVFIVARVRNALIAFGVDEVKEVIDGSEVAWQPMPEMPAAELFDRYAILNGEIVLRTGFENLLEAKTGMHAVAQWTATQSPAAAVDAPAPEEHKSDTSVAASIAATIAEPPPIPPRPAVQRPARVRAISQPLGTTRQPSLPQSAAPRLHPRPERRFVPPQAVRPEAPALDDAPPPVRKGAPSPAYWFGGGALAIAVLASAWFAYAPAPAEAPAVAVIRKEAFTVTVERPAKADPAPAVPQPASQGNARVHVVARGDTLSAIARTYLGDGLRYAELAQLSRIDNPNRIYPGDIVRIEVHERR